MRRMVLRTIRRIFLRYEKKKTYKPQQCINYLFIFVAENLKTMQK